MMTSGEKAVRDMLGEGGLDTREDYIWASWGNEPPEPWTARTRGAAAGGSAGLVALRKEGWCAGLQVGLTAD